MTVPILTAVGDPGWESELTAGLRDGTHGVRVVRRCVDLADLLAAAAAGSARAAVVAADLRRFDRDALVRLEQARVAVVGLIAAGDDAAEHRLRQLGVQQVVPHDATSEVVSQAIHAAMTGLAALAELDPDPLVASRPADGPAARSRPTLALADEVAQVTTGAGRLLAVWGAAGAPGRSTVAVNLGAELAVLGHSVILVDADTYGGVAGQLLGVLDESPGIAAACRLANAGALDVARLAAVTLEIRPSFRLLSGITRAERWSELRPASLSVVLELARSLASYVVVDCGFCLEQQEELSYDTAAPRRNGATLTALGAADVVVGVAAADPVGLARHVRALPECLALAPRASMITIANRLRRGVVGAGEPRRQVVAALGRYAGIAEVSVIPEDRASLDVAIAAGRSLGEVAPKSPARIAIRGVAERIAGATPSKRGRRHAG